MSEATPVTIEPLDPAEFSYKHWRERFLQIVLRGSAIVGLLACVASSIDVLRHGMVTLAIVYTTAWLILLAITLGRWPYWLRAGGVLFLCYGLGLVGLLENGMRGDARLFLLMFIIMAALLVSPRTGIMALAGSLLTIAIVAGLIFSGHYTLSSKVTVAGDVALWIVSSLSLILLATVSLTALTLLVREFDASQGRLKKALGNLRDSHRSLEQTYDATLEGWSHALELRDRETEDHSKRVLELTLHLADAVGMPDEEIPHLRRGVLLHDIGKLGVPDEILRKPGPLTEAEWVEMRRHPNHAYDLLQPIPYLHPALNIPFCHHEKWDGSGYPRQLKGEEIPLEARVFAIVDVWDALGNDRPYRKRFPKAEVHAYLRDQAGKHFDPHLVELFLAMVNAQ